MLACNSMELQTPFRIPNLRLFNCHRNILTDRVDGFITLKLFNEKPGSSSGASRSESQQVLQVVKITFLYVPFPHMSLQTTI